MSSDKGEVLCHAEPVVSTIKAWSTRGGLASNTATICKTKTGGWASRASEASGEWGGPAGEEEEAEARGGWGNCWSKMLSIEIFLWNHYRNWFEAGAGFAGSCWDGFAAGCQGDEGEGEDWICQGGTISGRTKSVLTNQWGNIADELLYVFIFTMGK